MTNETHLKLRLYGDAYDSSMGASLGPLLVFIAIHDFGWSWPAQLFACSLGLLVGAIAWAVAMNVRAERCEEGEYLLTHFVRYEALVHLTMLAFFGAVFSAITLFFGSFVVTVACSICMLLVTAGTLDMFVESVDEELKKPRWEHRLPQI